VTIIDHRRTAVEVLYLDESVAVVNKPSGELVHPGWARDGPTSMQRLRDALGARVHPVHRLDRGTSGALVFARTPEAARALRTAWDAGSVQKCYLALVRGTPPEDGVIDSPVRRGETGAERVPAVTHFQRLKQSPVARCCLVQAEPKTGRLHQVRRHLHHISHPIVGDVNYGDGRVNRLFRAEHGLHRLALHALSIVFPHPDSGAMLPVTAPLPPDLRDPFTRLGTLP